MVCAFINDIARFHAARAVTEPVPEAHMAQIFEQWRLDAVAHTERLVDFAMHEMHDLNEAHMMVHGVMWRAMTDMMAPTSGAQLDTALKGALRTRALV